MHWVVQNNLFNERGFHTLMQVLEHGGIPHTLVKVIPFDGGVEPSVDVSGPVVVPDGVESVAGALRDAVAAGSRLVVTTGGTGMGPRDLTPEGTREVITRDNPGLAELLRREGARHTPFAAVTRGLVGVVDWPAERGTGGTLVVNLPGRPSAVQEGMDVIGPLLGHLLDQVAGGDH